jgi:uncharacterized protein with GYD domain
MAGASYTCGLRDGGGGGAKAARPIRRASRRVGLVPARQRAAATLNPGENAAPLQAMRCASRPPRRIPQRRSTVATFISLVSFTDQGIRNVKDSPDRFEAFRALAQKAGVTVKSVYYTVGSCDMVTIVEGAEDAVTAVLLKVGSLGNVRSQTLRAFSVDEMRAILGKVA